MKAHLARALAGVVLFAGLAALAQPTSNSPLAPPPNGVRRLEPNAGRQVFKNATVHMSPERTLERATVVIRDGRIESVTEDVAADAAHVGGSESQDCTGLHLYAGFIEPYLEVDVPRPDANAPGTHWNARVTPERRALDQGAKGIEDKTAATLRGLGFGAAAITPKGGIFRGFSSVVSLGKPGDPSAARPPIYRDDAYQSVGFDLGRVRGEPEAAPDTSRWTSYPDSQMGAIALMRQTLSDAAWQQAARAEGRLAEPPNALTSLAAPQVSASEPAGTSRANLHGWNGLFVFDTADSLEPFRAAKIAEEFQRPFALLGSGQEYRRLAGLAELGASVILPLNFPRAPKVGTIGEQNATELEDLMHWEQAPTNARRLDEALASATTNDRVSLTTSKIPEKEGGRGSFDDRLGKAIKHGLHPDRALAMLTTNPAKLLGVERDLGTIEKGKIANLILADGPLFNNRPDAPKKDEPGYVRNGRVLSLWIDGREHVVKERPSILIGGHYDITLTPPPPAPNANSEMRLTMEIDDSDRPERPDVRIIKTISGGDGQADKKADGQPNIEEITISDFAVGQGTFRFSFEHTPFGEKGVFVSSGVIEHDAAGAITLRAEGVRASGRMFTWVAKRTGPVTPRKRSLAGSWPVMFDQPGASGNPVLVFDKGNVLTPQLPPGVRAAVEGKPITVDNFTYDGTKIRYDFDQSQVLGLDGKPEVGIVTVEATIDWSMNPPRMKGTVVAPAKDVEGPQRFTFTSIRRAEGGRSVFAGSWRITQADGQAFDAASPDGLTITIEGKPAKPTVKLTFTRKDKPPLEIDATNVESRAGKIFFKHPLAKLGMEGESRDELTMAFDANDPAKDALVGLGRLPNEEVHAYQAARVKDDDALKKETAAIAAIPAKLALPFGPYGLDALPAQQNLIITGATLWTCKDGTTETVVEDGAVVVSEGRISYVGPSASMPRLPGEFKTIDAKGKFITPGIIDCHSHTGISKGVNEAGQAVTAEVRIGDVTDPDDVSWYRQLAGGVTCVNNLHGSANAIGGQSMVNKIRWGCVHPDDMHFEGLGRTGSAPAGAAQLSRGALPGIKFALGENPKQSNWGDRNTTRYPQTRMGVETLIRDRFAAAKEYSGSKSPRRDFELEALVEVLAGTRLIHCHSYRQDEILMLTRIARDFNFKIGTFQHILEGYKVADEMAKYSGGGSAFSDWWAFKMEVQDAIPAAGPLMAEQGVTVSYNSDSDDLARRLNVEAGKATKYSHNNKGGPIPPHEAFKFVTLNPARQLHVDQFTGTLEAGKDADIAIWSGLPISPTSRCEMTLVDGRMLFSLEQDAAHRTQIATERARLIQKVLAQPDKGAGGGDDAGDKDTSDSADTSSEDDLTIKISLDQARAAGRRLLLLESLNAITDYQREYNLNLLRRGLDPRWTRAGDCGCGIYGGGN